MLIPTILRPAVPVLAALALVPPAAADVTVQQQSTFDLSFIKAHTAMTQYTTSDKQRDDSQFSCEGFMSIFCNRAGDGGEITRLDRNLKWILMPKKQEYREEPFPTQAQWQAMQARMEANLEKMKQCPAVSSPQQKGPDTSKCEMSPAKIDVNATSQHATLLGHDAKLTELALTQSCHNPQTGDTCDFVITMDYWLTQDSIPGLDEQRAFSQAYAQKMGLTGDNAAAMMKQVRQFLAPYAANLKELSKRAADFKGYPLKSAFRISYGGAQCAAARESQSAGGGGGGAGTVADASQAAGSAAASTAAGAATSAATTAASNSAGGGVLGSVLGSATSAFTSKIASGLFRHKSEPAPASSTPATSLPPNTVQLAQFTLETTAITPGPVAASEFEIPAGWKLAPPPPERAEKEFTCPKNGS
ncbi:MAG: hypothetical protein JSR67_02560 [Proteobacteria bacterium]|nr:hypothetical protein [Pseudomonadota bacterium]